MRRLLAAVSLIILAWAAVAVPLPLFLERPRTPLDLAEFVTVASPDVTPVEGEFLLTAVTLRRATVADLVIGLFDDEVTFVGVPDILAPGEQDRAFFDAQRELFAGSTELAAAVGLEAAGYEALQGAGAEVVGVQEGSPADGVLAPGDVIVAVDGEEIGTSLDLVQAVTDPQAEGEERRLTVLRRNAETRVSVTPRPLTRDAPQLGVQAETLDPRIALPFDVSVDAGRIGGPSAGLMVALTVYDLIGQRDIAGGRSIAGTGQIEATGAISPIGGLPNKVLAADRAGAEVFLAPESQVEQALAALPPTSDMEVVGVATFQEAVAALDGG
jgi:Lon-like protease